MDGSPLFVIPPNVQTRWASPENPAAAKGRAGQANGGRKGSPCFALEPGETRVLAEATGTSGVVRRIWATIDRRDPKMLRGLRLDAWWDGAERPAISVPLGDFFGHGAGRMAAFESALFACPEGRSFNSFVPMPFRTGMRLSVTNETDERLGSFFYDVDFTVGDRLDVDALHFHAHFRRENPTVPLRDFEVLPAVRGRGRYVGALFSVIANQQDYLQSWWGEGELKVYLDGDDALPTLCGTGTEDLIGTGWGQGRYAQLYHGCPIADAERMQYVFYRLHVPDPVFFRQDVRVTMQQIGHAGREQLIRLRELGLPIRTWRGPVDMDRAIELGGWHFERHDDWASCAYFYLDRPDNDLPPLPPVGHRIAGLSGDADAAARRDQ